MQPMMRLTLPLGIGADQIAQGLGSIDHEIIFGLENSVAQRAGITGRGRKRQRTAGRTSTSFSENPTSRDFAPYNMCFTTR